MARLRKPSVLPPEPQLQSQSQSQSQSQTPLIDPATTTTTTTMRQTPTPRTRTRSSPRKPAVREWESTTRELRYTTSTYPHESNSNEENRSSFLIPKIPASIAVGGNGRGIGGETSPKKQRALRPVASNSRLLRKLSCESLATPEKRTGGDGGGRRGEYCYARSLVRMRNGRGKGKGKGEIELDVGGDEVDEVDVEVEKSVLCGEKVERRGKGLEGEGEVEEEVVGRGEEGGVVDVHEDGDEDEDDESIVDVRTRKPQRQVRARAVVLDSDEEDGGDEEQRGEEENLSSVGDAVTANPQIQRSVPEPKTAADGLVYPSLPIRESDSAISNWAQDVVDLTTSPEPRTSFALPQRTQRAPLLTSSRTTSPCSTDADALLHFSPTPTKFRSPRKAAPVSRPSTPPPAPASPSKLISPSKKKPRIPTEPSLRPSLDAFWNPEVVGEWNDKHSPSKPLFSPRKQKWLQALDQGIHHSQPVTIDSDSDSDASFITPTTSPRKKPLTSPTKKPSTDSSPTVAQLRAQRKLFSTEKHTLAATFLTHLDTTITSGRITTLSAPTGGIKLLWSKTLKTTAGRANWRREQIRIRTGPLPTDPIRTEIRHHCSIELAEKVIDDTDRLYNVLAHEYCHLTTFMISEVRNNPHGAEFKSWARKVSKAFEHMNVEVTTKHSYDIAYKYVWECVGCGYEFKRHSKSVDVQRHSCGKCKGRLVQTKPTPRGAGAKGEGGGKGKGKGESGAYQGFVKENFARVKRDMAGRGLETSMGKVMEEVAREYRVWKEGEKEKCKDKEAGDFEKAFEGLKIGE